MCQGGFHLAWRPDTSFDPVECAVLYTRALGVVQEEFVQCSCTRVYTECDYCARGLSPTIIGEDTAVEI